MFLITFLFPVSTPALKSTDIQKQIIKKQVVQISKKHGVNPRLIIAIIEVESDWRPKAVSCENAVGLCQIKPSTAKYITGYKYTVEHLKNPYINVSICCLYINYLYDKYDGCRRKILRHYSGGAKNYYSKIMYEYNKV